MRARPVLVALALACGLEAHAEDLKGAAPPERERFRWPIRGPIVAPFKADANDGVDIAAPVGEPVHAAADGQCIAATEELKTFGKLVALSHANGAVTVYADLKEIDVSEGDKVRRGQVVGKSGESGAVASPRLHFELRRDGKPIDPLPFMAPL